MSATKQPAASDSLSKGTIARYAAGSLGTGGFATLPGLVLVYYLTDSLGVTALAAGLITTAAKVLDVVIDPIIGRFSDSSRATTGSRKRLMLIGAVGLPIAFILTFAVPGGLSPIVAGLWVLIAFMLAATFFSLFQVPYIALPAELTTSYKERTRLLTMRVVVLTLAILLFGAGGPEIRGMFADAPLTGYLVMAIVAAIVLAIGMLIATRVGGQEYSVVNAQIVQEDSTQGSYRAAVAVLRDSRPFRVLLGAYMLQGLATGLMLAAAQFVARWLLDDEGAVTILFLALIAPALFAAPLWRTVADRIGKERAFRYASMLFLIATAALSFSIVSPGWWMLAPVAIAGAAYAGMQTLPMAMLPDVIAHDKGGRGGVFSGVWTAGETTGMALGATVLTLVLAATGYIESVAGVTVTQPPAALAGIAIAFSALPALLMALSLIFISRYTLRETDIAEVPRV